MDKPSERLNEAFLRELIEAETVVSIFLINGIRLQGKLAGFDQYSVSLQGEFLQLVYKRGIATILPASAPPPSGEYRREILTVRRPKGTGQ